MAFKYATPEQLAELKKLKDFWFAKIQRVKERTELALQIKNIADYAKLYNWPTVMRRYQPELGALTHAYPDIEAAELICARVNGYNGPLVYGIQYWSNGQTYAVSVGAGTSCAQKIMTKWLTCICSGYGYDYNLESFDAIKAWVEHPSKFLNTLALTTKELDNQAPIDADKAKQEYDEYYAFLVKQEDSRGVVQAQIQAQGSTIALNSVVQDILKNPIKAFGFGLMGISLITLLILFIRSLTKNS